MAELNKKFFGNLTGTFGDVVFRQRGSSNYVAQRPKNYTAPDTETFRARTGKFGLAIKLSSNILKLPTVKDIWNSKLSGDKSAYQNLVADNYPSCSSEDITGKINIVPEDGIGVMMDSCVIGADKLTLTLAALTENAGIDINIEKKIRLISLLFLNNPLAEGEKSYMFLKINSAKIDFNLTEQIVFDIPFSTADVLSLADYQDKKAYFTVITYDDVDKFVNYAKTFSYTSS
jgi:hypothetical protein